MRSISSIMTQHHRLCDQHFSDMENAAAEQEWGTVDQALTLLCSHIEDHFSEEENFLFPDFEQQVGSSQGPTQVMRMEHQQVRELLESLKKAVQERSQDQVMGYSDTLMIMVQQHNMKEEQILYPMIDEALGDDQPVLGQLEQLLD